MKWDEQPIPSGFPVTTPGPDACIEGEPQQVWPRPQGWSVVNPRSKSQSSLEMGAIDPSKSEVYDDVYYCLSHALGNWYILLFFIL